VSHPSHHEQDQADNEKKYPDHQQDLGEGESRDQAWKQESEDDEDDSENDHDADLISDEMCWRTDQEEFIA
jgi:hypothetical protein